jgi:hypothetical protein
MVGVAVPASTGGGGAEGAGGVLAHERQLRAGGPGQLLPVR